MRNHVFTKLAGVQHVGAGVCAAGRHALPGGWAGLYGMRAGITTLSGGQLGQTAQPYTVQAPFTGAQLAAAKIKDPASLRLAA